MTLMIAPIATRAGAENARNGERANGGEAFTTGLSADGREPATHFACCGELTESEETRLKANAPAGVIYFTYDPIAEPDGARRALERAGLRKVNPQATRT